MNTEILLEYAPIIVVVLVFFVQQRIIVSPEQLERKHREILSEIELRYAQLRYVADLKEQVDDINEKITKVYDIVLAKQVNN